MINIFIENKIKDKKTIKSFTLVETLVAMTVIIMAILGPLTVAVYSYTYATETRDKITATYLAGESVELLRYKRDSLFIKYSQSAGNPSWSEFKTLFGNPSSSTKCYDLTNGCAFDIFSIEDSVDPIVSSCSYLYRDSVTNLYSCNGNPSEKTSYSRKITMEDIANSITDEDDVRVISSVTYRNSNGISKTVSLIDFIHKR